jgi:nicotinic acid mononucleotide adenylyltransferase/nicotinamide mononucleotide (NMN) deamidase PncC
MHLPDPARLIAALAAADRRLVVVATGGGSRAIPHLVTTPGASAVVLEASVPYARAAVDRILGGPQETYCAPRTARRLAAAAWQRAAALHAAEAADAAGSAPAERAVGAAVTASLRSSRPKRGSHRICAAVQTLAATHVAELVLEKDIRSRSDEEEIAAALVLDLVAEACGVSESAGDDRLPGLRPGERVRRDCVIAPAGWRELLAGTSRVVGVPATDALPATGGLVFPGSFDPLHEGHRRMAEIAEEIAERPLACELSVTNVDKPMLDYVEIRDRAAQFGDRRLWLTRAATFLEKLDVFPESTFVMGADTYVRLADPRYYGDSPAAAAAAVEAIATRARGLIVFGRARGDAFEDASHLDAPQVLRDVSYFVSRREFRLDISSTQLRRERREREEEEKPCDD